MHIWLISSLRFKRISGRPQRSNEPLNLPNLKTIFRKRNIQYSTDRRVTLCIYHDHFVSKEIIKKRHQIDIIAQNIKNRIKKIAKRLIKCMIMIPYVLHSIKRIIYVRGIYLVILTNNLFIILTKLIWRNYFKEGTKIMESKSKILESDVFGMWQSK